MLNNWTLNTSAMCVYDTLIHPTVKPTIVKSERMKSYLFEYIRNERSQPRILEICTDSNIVYNILYIFSI